MGERGHQRISEAAVRLLGSERSRVPVALFSTQPPGLTLTDAYRIQAATIACRVAGGARVVGHKVGVTSPAMQEQMRVDEPDSGVLLDDMVLPDGSELARRDFLSPRIEAEIAFRLGRDLKGPDLTVEDARGAVSEVFLALEVIDTRFAGWRIALADSIADNASCARVVTGAMVRLDPAWDLAAEPVVVSVDGRAVATGEGRAVLGDPLRPLVWLADRLSDVAPSQRLRAGDLVLAGAVHASLPLEGGTTVRATAPHLPPVHLHVA
ncbi:2-keto-4-pentenoate hydratase [Streptomyces sp. TRM64462]|uniref:2-keto-4-pentenoate hydratase n=1 Tax=Streptomyces sp. TRM64462 TaxID=2741726 RepID=UPI001585FB2A|nr:fumarylacetoacetate hydrolase family protein [Streptomyces sp. TRM64462]